MPRLPFPVAGGLKANGVIDRWNLVEEVPTLRHVIRNERYTQLLVTRPFISGLALFSFGAALLALGNAPLLAFGNGAAANWGEWARYPLPIVGLVTVLHVWSNRYAHRSRAR